MPGLLGNVWNENDELQEVDLGGGGKAFYIYAGGQRVRKLIRRQNGTDVVERIYLGGWELYRRHQTSSGVASNIGGLNKTEEIETLHVMDDQRRVAMVESRTVTGGVAAAVVSRARYQLEDHLGTCTVELTESEEVITYEEYFPYGAVAYSARSTTAGVELSPKRYRFTTKERDEETGLDYFGARYYMPWLGRWLSADPAGFVDGPNLYQYAEGAVVNRLDPTGTESAEDRVKQRIAKVGKAATKAPGVLREVTLYVDVDGKVLVYRADGVEVENGRLSRILEAKGDQRRAGTKRFGRGDFTANQPKALNALAEGASFRVSDTAAKKLGLKGSTTYAGTPVTIVDTPSVSAYEAGTLGDLKSLSVTSSGEVDFQRKSRVHARRLPGARYLTEIRSSGGRMRVVRGFGGKALGAVGLVLDVKDALDLAAQLKGGFEAVYTFKDEGGTFVITKSSPSLWRRLMGDKTTYSKQYVELGWDYSEQAETATPIGEEVPLSRDEVDEAMKDRENRVEQGEHMFLWPPGMQLRA